jgi:hypothetical protein
MAQTIEKLLYSRRNAAEALSLSVRSIDYLITTRRLPMRRVGGKIMIPASAIRRFADSDHPERLRGNGQSLSTRSSQDDAARNQISNVSGRTTQETA